MSQTILFHIERLGYFKTLGPVIEEALKRGYKVGLLYNSLKGGYQKGVPVPKPQLFPKFKHGEPNNIAYEGVLNFARTAQEKGHCLVLHMGYIASDYSEYVERLNDKNSYPYQYNQLKNSDFPIVCLASHYYDHCLWPLEAFGFFDKYCVLSCFSVESHKKILIEEFKRKSEKSIIQDYSTAIDKIYEKKVVITGSGMFDAFQKVYKYRKENNDKTSALLFMPKIDNHPFMKIFMHKQSFLKAFMRSFFLERGNYFMNIFSFNNFSSLLNKLHVLLEENNLDLIVKSRPKHNDQEYKAWLENFSKKIYWGENESYYPNIIADILKYQVFSIHIRSFSVLESVISGVPAINFQVPIISSKTSRKEKDYIEFVRSHSGRSMFNFEGCVWNYPWENQNAFFTNNISNIIDSKDKRKRKEYIDYFCGISSEQTSSEKQIDVIEKYLIK